MLPVIFPQALTEECRQLGGLLVVNFRAGNKKPIITILKGSDTNRF
jgi:hypothetical protein